MVKVWYVVPTKAGSCSQRIDMDVFMLLELNISLLNQGVILRGVSDLNRLSLIGLTQTIEIRNAPLY